MEHSPFAAVIEAFNCDDAERRVDLLRTCLDHDAEVSHINAVSTGPAEFAADIGQIREWLPGCTGALVGAARSVQNWDRQDWTLHTADGTLFAAGEYVGRRSAEGRYTHLASIPDAHEPPSSPTV